MNKVAAAGKLAAVELADIRANRRRTQDLVLNARRQDFAGEGFPLHVNERLARSASKFDCEVETSASGEQRDGSYSHTQSPSSLSSTTATTRISPRS